MSWVFLTDRHAYKLKKPVRHAFLDYSTVARRHSMCQAELTLNRRLADWVYLRTVPLVLAGEGRIELGGEGRIVDWLVEMLRLPERELLDNAIHHRETCEPGLMHSIDHLVDFYRRAPAEPLAAQDYLQRFRASLRADAQALEDCGLPASSYRESFDALRHFLEVESRLLEARVNDRRIVEGHGDLRPEHVYTGSRPAIIDCIEFSRALRIVDPLDEFAFLAMECSKLDAERLGLGILNRYISRADAQAPEPLVDFYAAARACLRAKLSLWHLHDVAIDSHGKWRERADHYLDLAHRHARRL